MKRWLVILNVLAFTLIGMPQSVFAGHHEKDASAEIDYYKPYPFGTKGTAVACENVASGKWWEKPADIKKLSKAELQKLSPEENALYKLRLKQAKSHGEYRDWFLARPREKALAFAVYTQDHGVLKITAQTFPLYPKEPKKITLELKKHGAWEKVETKPVLYPGWSSHFRVENWDGSKDVPYRLSLGELSIFEGTVRKDPVDKETIVVASMSCNSPRDKPRYERKELVQNLIKHDPDLLFFAGDQNYTHDEHTYGWLMFGVQYADVMKDRPTVTITDDHDIGHGNLWGENGKVSTQKGNTDGGYKYPAEFVKMVERCETWHLPDAFDPTPIQQSINVYYTDLNVGGISFAILEDRKFKTGPQGRIPKMGPRYDHINDPNYDRSSVDLPGLKLLGDRQLKFLDHWARDWTGAQMKAVLSQTAFCGAVHLHNNHKNRLLADLDCNGWPQSGRNRAVSAIRRALAIHLCGDQHLAVVVKHGIEGYRDGPWAFTGPALVNTIYGRWWWPENEKPGGGAKIDSPLPWTGDYEDGLGNKITMMAYANPDFPDTTSLRKDPARENRGDGYGLVHFNKKTRDIKLECWPRFADLSQGDKAQFKGWPITFNMQENDGRKPIGKLPAIKLEIDNPVISVTHDKTGELVYCYRLQAKKGSSFEAPVYEAGDHTVKVGQSKPEQVVLSCASPK